MNSRKAWFATAALTWTVVGGCLYSPMVSPDVLEPGQTSAGASMYGARAGPVLGRFGYSSIHGRCGLGGGYEMGFGYMWPLGIYVDGKRQLTRQPLSAFDLCLSVDRRASSIEDSLGGYPPCWVPGVTPSLVVGTEYVCGGVQVLAGAEMVSPRPRLYYFPGLIAGASYWTDENPFRIVPSMGLFIDPHFDLRPLRWLASAGVAVMFDFGIATEE
ncbi:hypothetical protein JXD38_11435 [candidate division WOR-3 bacterium]|nr:hypothetical protein [candidate division WOR-3 bacterium]